jgi:hypothetical protein
LLPTDSELADILYCQDKKFIRHTFYKPIDGDDFRNVLNSRKKIHKENSATKWLSGDWGNSALLDEDTTQSKENWFPHAIKPVGIIGLWSFQNDSKKGIFL